LGLPRFDRSGGGLRGHGRLLPHRHRGDPDRSDQRERGGALAGELPAVRGAAHELSRERRQRRVVHELAAGVDTGQINQDVRTDMKHPSLHKLREHLDARDKTIPAWSIHVDEVSDWRPRSESFLDWLEQALEIYRSTLTNAGRACEVVVALSLKPTTSLETFEKPISFELDFFTPPSIYVVQQGLEFPVAGEQYYRVLGADEFRVPVSGVLVVRSARSLQAMQNGWEFDNVLYIASRFGRLTA
jgi:hypothetical protein